MKQIFAIAIIVLSINAIGQGQQLYSHLQKPSNSHALDTHTDFSTIPKIGLFNIVTNRNAKKLNNLEQEQAVHIVDSVYYWSLDTLLPGMKLVRRTIDIVYDGNNNEISNVSQNRNGNVWLNVKKEKFSYDANKNPTSYLIQNWDGITWQNSIQIIDSFDIKSNLISSSYQSWDGSEWLILDYQVLTYDTNNDRTGVIEQSWNGNSWDTIHISQTNDANHNCISRISQSWDGSSLNNKYQDSYTYDANNNNTEYLGQIWQDNSWIGIWNDHFTYDINNNMTHYLSQHWNGSVWVDDSHYDYTYDTYNNLTGTISQTFNGSNWVNNFSAFITYDTNNYPTSNSYNYWNDGGTKITRADSCYYFFHTIYTGLNNLIEIGFNTYPNPATNKITISTSSILPGEIVISIVGLNGQQIKRDSFQNQKLFEMDVSTLPKGIYLIKIQTKNGIETKKLVIQ